jgi:PAS domain S-box-containing protein
MSTTDPHDETPSARRVLEALPYAAILTDVDGTISAWNRHAERLYGWSAAEVVGKGIVEVLVPELSQEQATDILARLHNGHPWSGYFSVQRKDGTSFPAYVQDIPIAAPEGGVTSILGLSSLATEQVIFSDTFEIAMRAGQLGLWEWDVDTDRISWSESLAEVYGLEPGSLAGTVDEFRSRIHPDDQEQTIAAMTSAMEQRREVQFEHRILRPDGEVRWLEARGEPIIDPDSNALTGMRGVGVDITVRKQAEIRGTAREQRQAAIADLGREALTGSDAQTLTERAVALVAETLALPFVRVLEANDDQHTFMVRASMGWDSEVLESVAADDGMEHARYTLRTNQPHVVEDFGTETRFAAPQALLDHGIVSGVSAVIRGRRRPWGVLDALTNERRRFENEDVYFMRSVANVLGLAIEAREASQIREDFVSLASHELRNPLTTIFGFASLAQRRARQAGLSSELESLDVIVRESQRMITTLQSLVDLARLDSDELNVQFEPVDVVPLVASEVNAARTRHPDAKFTEAYGASTITVRSDGARVAQILTNLLDNAAKYGGSPSHATVTVVERDETVEVTVRDEGQGIAPEELAHVFERFYRGAGAVASQAGGSGLGLYISQQVAGRLGARITCASGVGEGCEFTIHLPAADSLTIGGRQTA